MLLWRKGHNIAGSLLVRSRVCCMAWPGMCRLVRLGLAWLERQRRSVLEVDIFLVYVGDDGTRSSRQVDEMLT